MVKSLIDKEDVVIKLHDLGIRFDLTPPAIFTGDNMEIHDSNVEASSFLYLASISRVSR